MTRPRTLTVMILSACLMAALARADAVVDWNAITSQTVVAANPPRPGPSAVLDFATRQILLTHARLSSKTSSTSAAP